MINDMPDDDERRRELALHRYIEAFDQGDLDVMEAVLSEALDDHELERQIAGVNAAIHAEAGLEPIERDAELIRSLILRHMPSTVAQTQDEPWPTVGEVAARIEGNTALRRTLLPPDRLANRQLLGRDDSLPEQATAASIARVAERLEVHASDRYWETFRREAVVVLMAHEEAGMELLAARKQRRSTSRSRRVSGEDMRS
jgi:hypothetical protein